MDRPKSKNGQYISDPKEIFDKNSKKLGPDDCWEWMAYKNPSGYGQTKIGGRNGKHILAHRLSWIVHYGEIKDGMHVCHKCDNPSCVNPKHLFLGTNLDNIKDRMAKGRSKAPWKGVPREKHPSCKVTDAQIFEMVMLRKSGKSISMIAPMFGITKRHISKLTAKFILEK